MFRWKGQLLYSAFVDAATFRAVLGQWPTGVAVVTTVVERTAYGLTASPVTPVPRLPALVSAAPALSPDSGEAQLHSLALTVLAHAAHDPHRDDPAAE